MLTLEGIVGSLLCAKCDQMHEAVKSLRRLYHEGSTSMLERLVLWCGGEKQGHARRRITNYSDALGLAEARFSSQHCHSPPQEPINGSTTSRSTSEHKAMLRLMRDYGLIYRTL